MTQELKSFGEWSLIGKLGSGGFGEVLHWRHRSTKKEIATKHLQNNPNLSADEIDKRKQRWMQEWSWNQKLCTANIVAGVKLSNEDAAFVDYLNDNHAWKPSPVIIMEYCNGGDVRTQLRRAENCNGLPEFEVREILKSLGNAIEFLHTQRIFHRDLKPDNIVIQNHSSGHKTYKLTDFGFARPLPEETAKQSLVGTCHYFAPEILEVGRYNNSVDYWSLGVIAYELCCGVLPFIPHQKLLTIIENIRKKPEHCIAITEQLVKANCFEWKSMLPMENNLSSIFSALLTPWLQSALNTDYKKRGTSSSTSTTGLLYAADEVQRCNSNSPVIFDALRGICATKILTIFCLTKYKYFYYEINKQQTMPNLVSFIEQSMKIKYEDLYIVLPVGHPHKRIGSETKPIDLYVADWQYSTGQQHTQSVMIYVLEFKKPFDVRPEQYVSETIKHFIQMDSCDDVPEWHFDQYVRDAHYMLTKEQQHLHAFKNGLKEYALTVEHEIYQFKDYIEEMEQIWHKIFGSLHQFNIMRETTQQYYKQRFQDKDFCLSNDFQIMCNQLQNDASDFENNIKATIGRYMHAKCEIKKAIDSKTCNGMIESDPFGLQSFRNNLLSPTHRPAYDKILKLCKQSVYDCVNERNKFLNNKDINFLYKNIQEIHNSYYKVKQTYNFIKQQMLQYEDLLCKATAKHQQQLFDAASTQMIETGNLLVDGALVVQKDDITTSMNRLSIVSDTMSMSLSTNELINDVLQMDSLMITDIIEQVGRTSGPNMTYRLN